MNQLPLYMCLVFLILLIPNDIILKHATLEKPASIKHIYVHVGPCAYPTSYNEHTVYCLKYHW